jgi:sugar lactone lactonase YvrE
VAADTDGNLYIADSNNHRIQRIAAVDGAVTTVAGTGTAGSGTNQLNSPNGVAVDADGNLYIADTSNFRIQRVAAVDGAVTTVAGTGT